MYKHKYSLYSIKLLVSSKKFCFLHIIPKGPLVKLCRWWPSWISDQHINFLQDHIREIITTVFPNKVVEIGKVFLVKILETFPTKVMRFSLVYNV